MFENKIAAFGIFQNKTQMNAATKALLLAGFNGTDIEIQYPTTKKSVDLGKGQQNLVLPFAAIGAIVGGIAATIIAVVITDQAHYLFRGLIFTVIFAVIFGVIFGAVMGALVGIGTPQLASKRYGNYIDSGGILLSVHINNTSEEKLATEILRKNSAQDLTLLEETKGWKEVREKLFANFLVRTNPS